MRAFVGAACSLLVFSGPVEAKEPPEDKVICKRQYGAETGSNFRRAERVCLKASEWKELEDLTDRTMGKIRERGKHDPNAPQAGMGGGPG